MAIQYFSGNPVDNLLRFIQKARDDPRIGPTHLSLYVSLFVYWHSKKWQNPISLYSHDIMPAGKIAASNTYHRTIRELHRYGYIEYIPSYNHLLGSVVYFLEF